MFGRRNKNQPITDIHQYFEAVNGRMGGNRLGGGWAKKQIMDAFIADVVDSVHDGVGVNLAKSLLSTLQRIDHQVAARANRVGGMNGASRGRTLPTNIDLSDADTQDMAAAIFRRHAKKDMIARHIGGGFGLFNKGGNFKRHALAQNQQLSIEAPVRQQLITYDPMGS
jgi:hypothetical protein